MELRHLRYFVAVARRLHFGRAAADLRIAQPSLSQQIRRLESELGTTLLQRTKRRVALTEAGRLFLSQAVEILAHADRAAVMARGAGLAEVGRLRVGLAPWMDPLPVTQAIRRLHGLTAGISVELRRMPIPSQIAALRDETLDVGFLRGTTGEPWMASESLVREPFILALPASHRLAQRRRVSLKAIAAEAYILPPRDALPAIYDLALKVCRDSGFIPRVRDQADQPETALSLVGAGLGIALVPAWLRRVTTPGVALRSLAPSPRILETEMAWRRDTASPIVQSFVQLVRTMVPGTGRVARGAGAARRRSPRTRS